MEAATKLVPDIGKTDSTRRNPDRTTFTSVNPRSPECFKT
jgi:hypothetical protein